MSFFIHTHGGHKFTYGDKDTRVCIRDIAHHLSNVARFSGATIFHYPVAQHCLGVEELIMRAGGTRKQRLRGLVHDAHEAVIGDFPTPFQKWLQHELLDGRDVMHEAKERLDAYIIPALTGESYPWSREDARYVDYFDKLMFLIEARQLFEGGPPDWYGDYCYGIGIDVSTAYGVPYDIAERRPEDVKKDFLNKYCELLDGEDDQAEIEIYKSAWENVFGPAGYQAVA